MFAGDGSGAQTSSGSDFTISSDVIPTASPDRHLAPRTPGTTPGACGACVSPRSWTLASTRMSGECPPEALSRTMRAQEHETR